MLLLGSLATGENHYCGPPLAMFIEGTAEQRLSEIAKMHAGGKNAIPALIRQIGEPSVVPVTLGNPYLSHKPPNKQYCGQVAAYLVELVLARETLDLHGFREPVNSLLQGNPDIYIYPLGYIVVDRGSKPISPTSLKKVQSAYAKWWEANSGKSMEDLRNDWRNGIRPLTESLYAWK